MIPPTRRQAELLAYLREHPRASYREIGDALHLVHASSVHRLLKAAEDRGHVRLTPSKARSIVVKLAPRCVSIPLCTRCGATTTSDRARACLEADCGVPGRKGVVEQHRELVAA